MRSRHSACARPSPPTQGATELTGWACRRRADRPQAAHRTRSDRPGPCPYVTDLGHDWAPDPPCNGRYLNGNCHASCEDAVRNQEPLELEALQQLKVGRKAKRLRACGRRLKEIGRGVSMRRSLSLNERLAHRRLQELLYATASGAEPRATARRDIPITPENADLAQGATSPASTEADRPKRPPTFEYDPRGIPELLR